MQTNRAVTAEPRTFTPREEVRMQSDLSTALRAMMQRQDIPRSLLVEAGEDVRQRAGLGGSDGRTLSIPTGAAMFAPSRIDIAKRDLTAASASGGGYLRGTDNISFIEMLRNRMVAFALGATRLSGLQGNVTIPKQTTGATAYWLSTEATAITEGNQVFGQLALTPRTVGAYTEVSRLLRLQSSPDVESIVMSDLAKQVAIAADLAVINGGGTEQPVGIIGTAGVGSVSGTTLGATGVIELQTDVAANNGMAGRLGYLTTPAVAALLSVRPELATTGTTRLWQGNVSEGSLFGLRAMTSQQCPSATMIFGDWSQVVVGEWGILELSINDAANFPAGIIGLRAMYTCDVGIRWPAAFSVASSIT